MIRLFSGVCLLLALGLSAPLASAASADAPVRVTFAGGEIEWSPLAPAETILLAIAGPDGMEMQRSFAGGETPRLAVSALSLADGSYTYKIVLFTGKTTEAGTPATVQEGAFEIASGIAAATSLPTFAEDLIVQGSICTGFDCISGEVFGFDTFRLKENNVRIHFDDTSNSATFPANDWRLVANDSENGGANYFAIENSTAGTVPFRVMSDALANALVVSTNRIGVGTATPVMEAHLNDSDTPTVRLEQNGSQGWTPQVWDVAGNEANFFVRDVTNSSTLPFRIRPGAAQNSLYIASNNNVGLSTETPEARLDVNGDARIRGTLTVDAFAPASITTGAITATTVTASGDVAAAAITASGSATASTLASTGAATVGSDLDVGGTLRVSGTSTLDAEVTVNAEANFEQRVFINAPADISGRLVVQQSVSSLRDLSFRRALVGQGFVDIDAQFKSTDVPVDIRNTRTGTDLLRLDVNGNLIINGTLTQGSNVLNKTDILPVDSRSVLQAVREIPISTWRYTADDATVRHLGPMAQDFYAAFGLGATDTGIAAVDADGIALASIQALAAENTELRERIERLERLVEALATQDQ